MHRREAAQEIKSYKTQSAMEYLMTYGWSILIIALVMVTLYYTGVFGSSNLGPRATPGACEVFRPGGPGTTQNINLEGTCGSEPPQTVAVFNGASSNIVISSGPNIAAGSPFTISGWVLLNTGYPTYPDIVHSNTALLSLFGVNLDGAHHGFDFYSHGSGGIANAGQSAAQSTNVWYYVDAVYDGSNALLYVDGTLVATAAGTSPGWSGLNIGGSDTFGNNNWNGYISNLQVYNTSLSQSVLNTLYLEGIGGAPVQPQNLLGWWPLNGNANDYSGNNNQGTTTRVTFINQWTSGYTIP